MINTLEHFYFKHGHEPTYWLAYSGGLDSHVLLHLFAKLREMHPIKICAIHVNHGLSTHADEWVAHCKHVCEQLKVEFFHQKVNAKSKVGESPEEVARESRYAVFAKLLAANDLLLTAHHQDDQAETVLLQLLRGSGPKGLSAMPSFKALSKGFHARPLLGYARVDLMLYAQDNQLKWVEDESNENIDFSRNYLRQKVIPLLKKQWPQVTKTFARSSLHCAEAQALLENMAEQDLQSCKGQAPNTLSVKKIVELDRARLHQLLRLWFKQSGLLSPSTTKLQQIVQNVLLAGPDRMPLLLWKGAELRRYQDDVYVRPSASFHDAKQILPWEDLAIPLCIAGLGTLQATRENKGLSTNLTDITVRFRQGGEHCHLPNRACHHSLKKLFQGWSVPHWERDRIPLIYTGDTLIAAVGYFIDDKYAANEGEMGYLMKLDK